MIREVNFSTDSPDLVSRGMAEALLGWSGRRFTNALRTGTIYPSGFIGTNNRTPGFDREALLRFRDANLNLPVHQAESEYQKHTKSSARRRAKGQGNAS